MGQSATLPSLLHEIPQPYFFGRLDARKHACGLLKNSSQSCFLLDFISAAETPLCFMFDSKITSAEVNLYGLSFKISYWIRGIVFFPPRGSGTTLDCTGQSSATAIKVSR